VVVVVVVVVGRGIGLTLEPKLLFEFYYNKWEYDAIYSNLHSQRYSPVHIFRKLQTFEYELLIVLKFYHMQYIIIFEILCAPRNWFYLLN
jgi:hypothetical protein